MNKRTIYLTLLFVTLMVFSMIPTYSFAETLPDIPPLAEKYVGESSEAIKPYLNLVGDSKSLDLTTEDIVTVHDDGTIDIVADGISMSIVPPFGWAVLTQDVFAQLDTYMMITNNIEDLLNLLKAQNDHAFALDLSTMVYAEFKIEEDALSRLFNSISEIPDSYLPTILDVVKNSYGIDNASVVETGNNKFFKIDARSEGYDVIVYSTFVGGKTLDIWCYSGDELFSDFDIEIIETMLGDLILS